jgi:hypothetical protein
MRGQLRVALDVPRRGSLLNLEGHQTLLTPPVGGFAASDVVELKLTMTCTCADAERV